LTLLLVCAACRAPKGAQTAVRTAAPAPLAATGTAGLGPAEILARTRAAMSALQSFEAHVTFLEHVPDAGTWFFTSTDYRFEPPDRHSHVSRTWPVYPNGTPGEASVGESRRIGGSFWSRSDIMDPGAWHCEPYDIPPPDLGTYNPPPGSAYLGLERTSQGERHHFRHQWSASRSDFWIEPGTWRVVRIEDAPVAGSAGTLSVRVLDAFDTPAQIEAPGPCHAFPTVTPEP
jgi:hypothetical protein